MWLAAWSSFAHDAVGQWWLDWPLSLTACPPAACRSWGRCCSSLGAVNESYGLALRPMHSERLKVCRRALAHREQALCSQPGSEEEPRCTRGAPSLTLVHGPVRDCPGTTGVVARSIRELMQAPVEIGAPIGQRWCSEGGIALPAGPAGVVADSGCSHLPFRLQQGRHHCWSLAPSPSPSFFCIPHAVSALSCTVKT